MLTLPLIQHDNVSYVLAHEMAVWFHGIVAWNAATSRLTLTSSENGQSITWLASESLLTHQADVDGDGTKETVYAIYNATATMGEPSIHQALTGEIWVTRGPRELWRRTLGPFKDFANAQCLIALTITDVSRAQPPALLVKTCYSGSGVHYFTYGFHWDGQTFRNILQVPGGCLDYQERGGLIITPPNGKTPAQVIRYDFLWDTNYTGPSRYYAEWYAWTGQTYTKMQRKVTNKRFGIARDALREFGIVL